MHDKIIYFSSLGSSTDWTPTGEVINMTDLHSDTCAQREKVDCPANKSLHGEPTTDHWWSGWPGAFCLKCGSDDKDELCIGDNCACPCHDSFWRDYEAAVRKAEVGEW